MTRRSYDGRRYRTAEPVNPPGNEALRRQREANPQAPATPGRVSAAQVQLIQIARRGVKLAEGQYRLLLLNIGGVESTKDLCNQSFEECMAILEDMGFVDAKHGAGYWGNAGARRLIWKAKQLAAQARYPIEAMTDRMTKGRTALPDELTAREAWQLIEAYKQIIDREPIQTKTGRLSGETGSNREAGSEPARSIAALPPPPEEFPPDDIPF